MGQVMVIKLVINFVELVKVMLKKGVGWVREVVWGMLGFVGLVCVWAYLCCSGGCFC
jgi:hypothetical protein